MADTSTFWGPSLILHAGTAPRHTSKQVCRVYTHNQLHLMSRLCSTTVYMLCVLPKQATQENCFYIKDSKNVTSLKVMLTVCTG